MNVLDACLRMLVASFGFLLLLLELIKRAAAVSATTQFDRSSIRALRHHSPPTSMARNRTFNRAVPAAEHLHFAQVTSPTHTQRSQRL
ncbi:MAG TPA: hypothetical protein VKR06_12045 [Ktedonosporobacter sp.]|nr:hypothetical protein [Ktedonosporobacter sp.]